MKGFLSWLGGKSQLAPKISEHLKSINHTCYCEPFMGGAHVFFRKEPAKAEVLNDINRDLTTLFRVLQHHPDEFMRHFKWAISSRDEFERLNKQNPDSLTDIQRASRFYYLQKLCFGGKAFERSFGTSTTNAPRLNLFRIEEELSQVHLRLARVQIENLPWQKIITRYDREHTLFYIDPPYFNCEAYYGKNIFERSEYREMASILKVIKGNFILSLNDHEEIRKTFDGFHIQKVSVPYTLSSKGPPKKAPELLISNVKLG
ncbi:MAG: DNA adenine methylase [Deltaproteobacteria bacterium]|nr:DNA adenine methylase [Deltaproteobacteria bacterium]